MGGRGSGNGDNLCAMSSSARGYRLFGGEGVAVCGGKVRRERVGDDDLRFRLRGGDVVSTIMSDPQRAEVDSRCDDVCVGGHKQCLCRLFPVEV